MTRFDESPEEADSDIRRVSRVLDAAEGELAVAEEVAEQIEQETPQTPGEEADVARRMVVAQDEIERLKQEVADAEGEFHSTVEFWGDPS